MQFTVGDSVWWSSQAGGSEKVKRGKVVAVVPAGVGVRTVLPRGLFLDGPGSPRKHESYLVQIGKRINIYWPLVKNLKFDTVFHGEEKQ